MRFKKTVKIKAPTLFCMGSSVGSLFSTSATAFFRVFRVLGAAFGFAGVLTALPERVFLTILAKSKVIVNYVE